jgi:hypothetical protein
MISYFLVEKYINSFYTVLGSSKIILENILGTDILTYNICKYRIKFKIDNKQVEKASG